MNARIKYLLNHPFEVSLDDVSLLQDEIDKYPYFPTLRALLLFGLKEHPHATYDQELKKTSIYSTSRTALYYYLQKERQEPAEPQTEPEAEKEIKPAPIAAISESEPTEVIEAEEIQSDFSTANDVETTDIPEEEIISKSEAIETPDTGINNEPEEVEILAVDEKEEVIETEDLEEDKTEGEIKSAIKTPSKMTFSQWLSKAKEAAEEEEKEPEIDSQPEPEEPSEKEIKFRIIDEFIDKAPKIAPLTKVSETPKSTATQTDAQQPYSDLMTETLARIYIDQKKFDKAIRAYKILIIKYPDKKAVFHQKIEEIEYLRDSK